MKPIGAIIVALTVGGWVLAGEPYSVGVARIDVTPDYPVRLSGFGFRRTESEGVTQKIWAKALALDDGEPAVIVAVDNLGVPASMLQEVADRLEKKGLKKGRLAITATHTHTAPMLTNVAPTLFGMPIPDDHQKRIDRYTKELTDNLEKVAAAALDDRKPAKLAWAIGRAGFAINRRTKDGPVDHDLPVLVVQSPEGKVRAIYVNYACHCVTLSNNKISGDWAGFAQQGIEDEFPDAVALTSVGCGADSNPSSGVTGDKVEIAQRQGLEIAAEVKRLTKGQLTPLTGKLTIASKSLELPLADLPDRAAWEAKAQRQDAVGYHARINLARLDRKELLKSKIDYSVQTWAFGDALAMIFLPGEVVVDYSLRLKRELNGLKLWVNAYANDAPCYIPSERVLKEGGYEGGSAMVYYDVPGPFKAGLEQKIIDAAHEQIGKTFPAGFDGNKTNGTRPMSPQQSLAAIKTKPDLTVELVASEPLVSSPVAIDWGPDGRLYVAEMYDYPLGLKGGFEPGGRVKVLEDTDGDGRYDKATVFLDGIPFPTGVTVWRKGLLVCAAPDILYAEDANGDGQADKVKKLFSGFGTQNYQARVNSLEYGLDGWVYGSCGLFGGQIKSFVAGEPLNLGDRDFRIKPDTGEIEPATGRTQQGRVRDAFGNWFGCDNSNLCRHYPLPDHYLRRNPLLTTSATSVNVPEGPDPNRLYPLNPNLQLFKLSGAAGRTTAACGLGIYKDFHLGTPYHGNAFVCEPVNLLVHRRVLSPKGTTFVGKRADDEKDSEFLASTDTWFRPVQVRTGPDGCLWVVDMYRFLIEHPRWIPPDDLAKIDPRAGSHLGRIYRVRPMDKESRPLPRLDRLDADGLAKILEFFGGHGWQRDMAAQMLLWRGGTAAVPRLERITEFALVPESRVQALSVLAGLGQLKPAVLAKALGDRHPEVVRHAVMLSEPFLDAHPHLGAGVAAVGARGAAAPVALQAALSLGAWHDEGGGAGLYRILQTRVAAEDPLIRTAVLSSLNPENVGHLLQGVLADADKSPPPEAFIRHLVTAAVVMKRAKSWPQAVAAMTKTTAGRHASWQTAALEGFLDGLERRGVGMDKLLDAFSLAEVEQMLARLQARAGDGTAPEAQRLAALAFYGRNPAKRVSEVKVLAGLLSPSQSAAIQTGAAAALGRIPDDAAAAALTAGWAGYSPALKTQVLDLLMSREAWLKHLLASLEKKDVVPGHVGATHRQRLLTHKAEAIRTTAARLFDGAASPDRRKVLDQLQDAATLAGDTQRGQTIFGKSCAPCHRLGEVGFAVGPDLAALANKTPAYLLVEILDPNRNVDTRYVEYQAVTKTGRTLTGLLSGETATSLTFRGQEGKDQVLLRADLDDLTSSGKSLMPEGLEKDLTKQNLADLIAFLVGVAPKGKPFAGNKPEVIKPGKDGSLALLATNGEIVGGDIAFEEPFRNVGYWHGADDRVSWTVELESAGEFDVWLDWSCDNNSAGNPFVFEGKTPLLRGKVAATGGWDKYRQQMVGTVQLDAGRHRLTMRPDGVKPNGALFDLRGIHLVVKGRKPDFAAAPGLPTDPIGLASIILDDTRNAQERQVIIADHPKLSADFLKAMTTDLQSGKEEYRRIPWIWRVAIAAGKRNDAAELFALLEVALPKAGEPLRDWQAVVIGGGLINGVGQAGVWPKPRFAEILKGQADLADRWQKALAIAAVMADDAKVPTGTRYDALRMIALDAWEKQKDRLAGYLARGTNDELTMGAISGLSDVDEPKVADLLLAGLEHFSAGNRKLALDALLRTDPRTAALLDALEKGQVKRSALGEGHVTALRTLKNDALRQKAEKLINP